MTTVADILAFLDTLAPRSLKMDWDNCGLLCGRPGREVRRILVALDPFDTVIDEAIRVKADLLVTHHPLIFRNGLMAVNEDTEAGRCVLKLVENGIAAINAHTNLDIAPGGINDVLAQTLGLAGIETIGEERLLRRGTVSAQPLPQFLAHVKRALGCDGLRYVDGGRTVCRVAVGGGACAGAIREVWDAGCDTFVTADVKYNQFWDAHDLGLNLIDAGHFWTENPVCTVLAAKLRGQFPEIPVEVSKNHTDCMKFFGIG